MEPASSAQLASGPEEAPESEPDSGNDDTAAAQNQADAAPVSPGAPMAKTVPPERWDSDSWTLPLSQSPRFIYVAVAVGLVIVTGAIYWASWGRNVTATSEAAPERAEEPPPTPDTPDPGPTPPEEPTTEAQASAEAETPPEEVQEPSNEAAPEAEGEAGQEGPVEAEETPARPPPVAMGADDEQRYTAMLDEARALEKKNKRAEAVSIYERAVQLNPNGSDVLSKLAFHYLNRGKSERAREFAARAVAVEPANSEGWIVLGAARHALKDRDGAREAYKNCVKLGKGQYVQECRRMVR